jgi:CRP-like cAMP-binding protein
MAQASNALLKQIKTLVPLKDLPLQDQQQILANSRVVSYRKGKRIFKQGDRDKWVLYLLEGELEMSADGRLVNRVVAGTENGSRALAQLQPRQLTATASTAVSILRIERSLLEQFLTLDQGSTPSEVEVSELEAEEAVDWMTALLRSELFASMPPTNIQRILSTLEPIAMSAGATVIEQGGPGDYYYIVQRGRCEVTRKTSGNEEVKLARLREGDTFGEEALVSDSTRNATVRMASDGELMRLTKSDFVELIKKPILDSVDYDKARSLVESGGVWVDARFPDEHTKSGIDGSLNIPLSVVRVKAKSLDADKSYVVYCDDGRRSSAAAFLLKARGLQAYHLSGGLAATPLAKPAAPPPPAAHSVKSSPPAPRRAEKPQPPAPRRAEKPSPPVPRRRPPRDRGAGDEPTDPEMRVSALSAQLARANVKLEEALSLRAKAQQASREAERQSQEKLRKEREALEAKAARADRTLAQAEQLKRAAHKAAEDKLRRERDKLKLEAKRASEALEEAKRLKMELESAKRNAEGEAERARKSETERMNRMQQDAEKRLHAEKAKLEQEYARTAEELARMQRLKQQSEAQLSEERKRLRAEADQAKAKLAEAQRLKTEMEAAREAAERQRRQHEEAEQKLRSEIEARISAERRKFEAEFARSTQELEKARQEKSAMDVARQAAADEAKRVIEQYRKEYENMRQEEEARLRTERERLERDGQRIQRALQEARRAKEEAELARAQAETRMSGLRAERPKKAYTSSLEDAEKQLRAEMAAIEKEFSQANEDLVAAEHARDAAEQAKKVNEKRMASQRAEVEQLRSQMAAEMEDWLVQQSRRERSDHHRRSLEQERMTHARMRQREEELRRKSLEHNQSLLDEISSQLKDKE